MYKIGEQGRIWGQQVWPMLHTLISQKGMGRLPYNVKKDEKKVLCLFPFEY